MRTPLLLATAAALSLTACRSSCASPSSTPDAAPPTQPPASAEPAPLPDAIKSLREADAAFQGGKLDEAITGAEAAVKAAPNNPVAWNLLGRSHAARYEQTKNDEEAKKAREAFSKAIAASPDFWPALQNLGELNEKTGNLQEAADAYRKVLKAQPAHPDKARFEAVIAKAEGAAPGKK